MKLAFESDDLLIGVSHPDSDLETARGTFDQTSVALLLVDLLTRLDPPRLLALLCETIQILDEGGDIPSLDFLAEEQEAVVETTMDYLEAWKSVDRKNGLIG